ncbi:DedA family protein [Falsihalocynthiibacter arcticus]|uniref:VTT domain-containing protein n=1 Tax=Falsihalocynthiibacter arcticus TaxID=1579316 RepID=A0A126UYN9_9RHOB|nr:VTT domain-containing protein [Falsihalocynthiibacter arcticus]AML51173.1 hypothetical protein RC74_07790 [Falsihalocynthiibacter arcticus]
MAHHHLLLPWQVASVAICGAYLSNLSVFFLGRRYRGQSRVQSILANKRLSGMLQKLNKNPARYASIFQFIPGMRIVGPIALAQSEIGTMQFAVRAGISALIWGVVYTVLGSAVGQLLGRVFGHVLHTKYVLIAAGLVLSAIFLRAIWNHFRSVSDH